MGVDAHCLRFLEHALRANGDMKTTLTVGHQALHVSKRELQSFFGAPSSSGCFTAVYVDDLLREYFGATRVSSVDASDYEDVTYVRDLNVALEPDFPKFDSVLDAGSLEHIFDIRVAFENVSSCCKVGGQILHVSPANNLVGHGFYQFSPEFFFSLYSQARGFAETEVYLADLSRLNVWWKVAAPSGVSRSTALSSSETYVLVRTKKVSAVPGPPPVQQSDYLAIWESGEEADARPSAPYSRRMLGKLAGFLPPEAKAKLMQKRRRMLSGMHSRNRALSHVRPPSRRAPALPSGNLTG